MSSKGGVYLTILNGLVDFLCESQGWSEKYASEVICEQTARVGQTILTDFRQNPGEIKRSREEAISVFEELGQPEDYKKLIDQICQVFSKYKTEDEIRHIKKGLTRVVNRAFV